jgi:hypothetical protein
MARRLLLIATCLLAVVAFSRPTLAETPPDAAALAGEIDHLYGDALASDCSTACRAFDSMRRSVERLCAIDAGDPCQRARAKLEDASRHVRAACPTCEQALERTAEPSAATAQGPATEAAAPPPHGGCASCTATGAGAYDPWTACLAAAVILVFPRKRR